ARDQLAEGRFGPVLGVLDEQLLGFLRLQSNGKLPQKPKTGHSFHFFQNSSTFFHHRQYALSLLGFSRAQRIRSNCCASRLLLFGSRRYETPSDPANAWMVSSTIRSAMSKGDPSNAS